MAISGCPTLLFTWGYTQTRMAAKEYSSKYYPIRECLTGASSLCRTHIPQAREHTAAYKQNADGTSGFEIELLRQEMA